MGPGYVSRILCHGNSDLADEAAKNVISAERLATPHLDPGSGNSIAEGAQAGGKVGHIARKCSDPGYVSRILCHGNSDLVDEAAKNVISAERLATPHLDPGSGNSIAEGACRRCLQKVLAEGA